MAPGTTLVLTDAAVLPKTTGQAMTVITTDDEPDEAAPPETQPPKR
jgi:hypothetical protein